MKKMSFVIACMLLVGILSGCGQTNVESLAAKVLPDSKPSQLISSHANGFREFVPDPGADGEIVQQNNQLYVRLATQLFVLDEYFEESSHYYTRVDSKTGETGSSVSLRIQSSTDSYGYPMWFIQLQDDVYGSTAILLAKDGSWVHYVDLGYTYNCEMEKGVLKLYNYKLPTVEYTVGTKLVVIVDNESLKNNEYLKEYLNTLSDPTKG